MADTYPPLDLPHPYRTEDQDTIHPLGNAFYKAVIASYAEKGDKVQKAHVYRLGANGWTELQVPWQAANKPNNISLAASGPVLEVTVGVRADKVNHEGDNYPSFTWPVSVLNWPSTTATPFLDVGEYASEAAFRADYVEGGKTVTGFIGRINRQVKRIQAVGDFLRFIGWYTKG